MSTWTLDLLEPKLLDAVFSFLHSSTIFLKVSCLNHYFRHLVQSGQLECLHELTLRPLGGVRTAERVVDSCHTFDVPSDELDSVFLKPGSGSDEKAAVKAKLGKDPQTRRHGLTDALLQYLGRESRNFLRSVKLSALTFDSGRILQELNPPNPLPIDLPYAPSYAGRCPPKLDAHLIGSLRAQEKNAFSDRGLLGFLQLNRQLTRVELNGVTLSGLKVLRDGLRSCAFQLEGLILRDVWIRRDAPPRQPQVRPGRWRQASSRYAGSPQTATRLINDYGESGLEASLSFPNLADLEVSLVWMDKRQNPNATRKDFIYQVGTTTPAISFVFHMIKWQNDQVLDSLTLRGLMGQFKVPVALCRKLSLRECDSWSVLPNALAQVKKVTLFRPIEIMAGAMFSHDTLSDKLPELTTLKIDAREGVRLRGPMTLSIFTALFREFHVPHLNLTKVTLFSPELSDDLLPKIGLKLPNLRWASIGNPLDFGGSDFTAFGIDKLLEMRWDSLIELFVPFCWFACQVELFRNTADRLRKGAKLERLELWGNVLDGDTDAEIVEIIRSVDPDRLSMVIHGAKAMPMGGQAILPVVVWRCPLGCGTSGHSWGNIDASVALDEHWKTCPTYHMPCRQCGKFVIPVDYESHCNECQSSKEKKCCPLDCGFELAQDGSQRMGDHLMNCPSNLIRCPCCEEDVFIAFADLEDHMMSSSCLLNKGYLWEVFPRMTQRAYTFCTRVVPLRRHYGSAATASSTPPRMFYDPVALGTIARFVEEKTEERVMPEFVSRRISQWSQRRNAPSPTDQELDQWRHAIETSQSIFPTWGRVKYGNEPNHDSCAERFPTHMFGYMPPVPDGEEEGEVDMLSPLSPSVASPLLSAPPKRRVGRTRVSPPTEAEERQMLDRIAPPVPTDENPLMAPLTNRERTRLRLQGLLSEHFEERNGRVVVRGYREGPGFEQEDSDDDGWDDEVEESEW